MGLLVALDALTSIELVEPGKYTILDMGDFTSKIWISILSFVVIALLMSRRVKGAFVIGIMLGSVLFWSLHPDEWPSQLLARPADITFALPIHFHSSNIYAIGRLVLDLLFIGECFQPSTFFNLRCVLISPWGGRCHTAKRSGPGSGRHGGGEKERRVSRQQYML